MTKEKIAILGGGSPFTPAILYSLLEYQEVFRNSEVTLMDIDPTRLPALTKLGEELSQRTKAKLQFTWTTNPEKALADATFVMPSYRIGGEKHMRLDFEIPTRLGIAGDETAGPGGTFMAQCTIPATLKYCRMIENLCPDAWVISYVNPTNFIADAVRRETNTKFIAICDCFAGFAMNVLPTLLNMPPFQRRYTSNEDLKPRAMGINHNTWLIDLLVSGRAGYPLFKRVVKEKRKSLPPHFNFPIRLLETYGYWNICADHSQMLWEHEVVLRKRRAQLKRPRLLDLLGWSDSSWEYVKAMITGAPYDLNRPEYCFKLHHSRHVVGIMVSILENEGREWGGISFPNNGAITNLPQNAIVEGPCLVDQRGLTPITMGDLPKSLLGITLHLLNWQELTVDAALTGDKDLLYQALLACPYVHDMKAAAQIMTELLEAHADHLPQFQT